MSRCHIRPAVILSMASNGGAYLRSLLARSSGVGDCGEIFGCAEEICAGREAGKYNYYRYRAEVFARNPSLSVPTEENMGRLFQGFLAHLDSFFPAGTVVLLDLKYENIHHMNPDWHPFACIPYILKLCVQLKIPVIHLVDWQVLKNYVWWLRSRAADPCEHRKAGAADLEPIEIKTTGLLTELDWRVETAGRFRSYLGRESNLQVEINYKEIRVQASPSFSEALSRIEDLLHITIPKTVDPQLQSSDLEIPKVVSNYDQVAAILRESKYAHLAGGANARRSGT